MYDDSSVATDNQFQEVERQYNIIKKRERILKFIKFLSIITFLASVLVIGFCPIYKIGDNTINYYNFSSLSSVKTNIEYKVSEYIASLKTIFIGYDLVKYLALWYVITKVVVTVISFILFIFKTVIGGFFKLLFARKPSYQDKIKVIQKYKKKNSNTVAKGVISFFVQLIISLIVPTLGDILDFKDGASSVFYPFAFAVILIFDFYIPLSLIAGGVLIDGVALSVDMMFVTIAMACAVVHALLVIVNLITKLVFKSHKLD